MLALLLSICDRLEQGVDVGGDHALVGELLAHEHGAERAAEDAFGGDVGAGARLVGDVGTGGVPQARG